MRLSHEGIMEQAEGDDVGQATKDEASGDVKELSASTCKVVELNVDSGRL